MMCYKDKTFCSSWKTCKKANTCDRALTPKVISEAEKWWGSKSVPISVTERFDCYEKI